MYFYALCIYIYNIIIYNTTLSKWKGTKNIAVSMLLFLWNALVSPDLRTSAVRQCDPSCCVGYIPKSPFQWGRNDATLGLFDIATEIAIVNG